jgi:SAM-dependent methyltransferase
MMNPDVFGRLLEINTQFYQTFAQDFSATRYQVQPGVRQLLPTIPKDARVLDLGCGNGSFGAALFKQGHTGTFYGMDFSAGLLDAARSQLPLGDAATVAHADFTSPAWDAALPPAHFDAITAFATLHHLPSAALHADFFRKVRRLLAPDGRFLLSNWQFLNSPRWRARVQPWETVGLSPEDVEPGDYLLDWRRGGVGYRYVHHFSETELAQLAAESGFHIVETFHSDGREGNLALYMVWGRKDK